MDLAAHADPSNHQIGTKLNSGFSEPQNAFVQKWDAVEKSLWKGINTAETCETPPPDCYLKCPQESSAVIIPLILSKS